MVEREGEGERRRQEDVRKLGMRGRNVSEELMTRWRVGLD